MSLICNVCNNKAMWKVCIDLGRFEHNFYYCNNHVPISAKVGELGKKQESPDKDKMQDLFVKDKTGEQK